jgi:hypothetical protein
MFKKIVLLTLAVVCLTVRIGLGEQEDQGSNTAVESYRVNPDLSNIENLEQFGTFTDEQEKLLSTNGFVVTSTKTTQLYAIYETNDYYQIPNFVTTDLVLQAYHIFFDYTLRMVESEKLYDIAVDLTERMLSESVEIHKQVTNPEVKQAALKNIAFFGVALRLLTVDEETLQTLQEQDKTRHRPAGWELRFPVVSSLSLPLPSKADTLIENELKLIQQHSMRMGSPIFGFDLDYTQFVPRGHYTRTERLRRYFAGLMWYGLVPFPVNSREQAMQTILFTHILFDDQEAGTELRLQWERLYEPTVFYVGSTDDLNAFHCKQLLDEVYGDELILDDIPSKLDEFLVASEKLPPPRIAPVLIGIPTAKQFRFMGQRYIADSEILQRLSNWPQRPFPKSLDVMAVLGSEQAYDILINTYEEDKYWDKYTVKFDSLREQFSSLELSTWQSNLYYGWLWCLRALLEEKKEGYHPFFMTNPAWQDKVLNTTCASWAELRHDTILYAKSSGAECGGEVEEPPPPPKGYVEPEIEFYSRLEWLTNFSREGLTERKIITPSLEEKFQYLADLISFLKRVSIKELQGEPLTREEYDQIKIIGADMERLSLFVARGTGEYYADIDRDMAVIADVHTSQDACLEEGVGHANEIYVVVPIEGKLYLTRGAVFSYYEFIHPARDRLTDEKWQNMLNEGNAPALPVWTKSFMTGEKEALPRPKKVYSSGC